MAFIVEYTKSIPYKHGTDTVKARAAPVSVLPIQEDRDLKNCQLSPMKIRIYRHR